MLKLTTNWDSLRQEMTNAAALMIKETRDAALNDVEQKLIEKGLSADKTDIRKNSVVFVTSDTQEFDEGQIYFDEVFKEISNDADWVKSL
jgi:hypothetical protein